MGQAKQKETRKKRFKIAHPLCCFCGEATETWDHLPPREIFLNRMYPAELEFPACADCNGRSRLDEMALIYYSLLSRDDDGGAAHLKAYKGLRNNAPEWAPRLMSSIAKRKAFRKLSLAKPDDVLFSDVPLVEAPREAISAIERVLCKLTCALAYKELGHVLPKGTVFWSLARPSIHLSIEELFGMMPFAFDKHVRPMVQRRYVDDIFSYSLALTADARCLAAAYSFGPSLCGIGMCAYDLDQFSEDGRWKDAFGAPLSLDKAKIAIASLARE